MAKTEIKINFMKYRKIAAGISIFLVACSFGSLLINQVNWGLDFTGGSLVEVAYDVSVAADDVRVQLDEAGFEGHVVQYFGSVRDVLVRIPPQKGLSEKAPRVMATSWNRATTAPTANLSWNRKAI